MNTILIYKYLKISIFFILLFLSLLNSGVNSYKEKSIMPFVNDIGGKLFLSTKTLAVESKNIINNDNLYDFSKGKIKGFVYLIINLSKFIFPLLIIYLYLKFFSFLYSNINQTSKLAQMTFAILTFYIIQIIFILSVDAIAGNIHSAKDAANDLIIPLKAIMLFFRAVFVIILPMSNRVNTFLKIPENITNISI